MGRIADTVDVRAPLATTYDQWTRIESFPRMMGAVQGVLHADSVRALWTIRVCGVTRRFETITTEQHPDELIAWRTWGARLPHTGVVSFRRLADDRTTVAVELDFRPHGWLEHAGSLLRLDRTAVRSGLRGFKDYVETHGADGPGWRTAIVAPDAE